MVLISAITMTLMYVILQNDPHIYRYNDLDVSYCKIVHIDVITMILRCYIATWSSFLQLQ